MSTVYDAALRHTREGWAVVPVPPSSKAPALDGWQHLRLAEAELARHFAGPAQNLGALLGAPSHDLVEVDLDCREALALAHWLPDTDRVSGRPGNPGSHRWYVAAGVTTRRFKDTDNTTIVELRSTGAQTLLPPSVHPSGERYAWDRTGAPASVAAAELVTAVARLAAGVLLARRWPPEGGRHDAALALAGVLLRAGWREASVATFIEDVARTAGDEESAARAKNAVTTARRLANGQQATGLPTLARLLADGEAVVERLRDWLDLPRRATGAPAEDTPAGPLPDAVPFPVETVPGAAGRLVREGAAALDVPPEFIAVPLLAFAGGTLGKRYCLELKPGYRQWPILYAAVVGAPGSGKSPAAALARQPLDRLQREAWGAYQGDMVAYKAALRAYEKARPEARGERPEPPVLAHYLTTDATVEALGTMLLTSPGVTNARDELVGWVKACDQYRGGKGGDRQKWLSGWSKDPWKIDRKKAEPVYVPDPVVCVVGGIQPEVLPELAHEAGARDGFIERILWAYPDEHFPDDTDDTVSETTLAAACQLFRSLRPAARTAPDAESLPIALDADARRLWRGWSRDNTRLLREATGLAQGIYAKLPNQAARLALILHCLAHPDRPESTPLGSAILCDALALSEYFRAHALRVLPRFGQHGAAGAGSLVAAVAAILDRAGGAWVARSAIRDALHRNPSAAAVAEALARLEEQGRAERRVHRDDGQGRPAEEWRSLATGPRRGTLQPLDDEEEAEWTA